MKKVMVRYKVKADRGDENQAYIEKVFEDLKKNGPDDLQYASFRQNDGVSFVHIAFVAGPNNPLPESAAFQAFTAELKDRCDEPPEFVEMTEVGSYRMFA